jgi:chitosanase
VTDLQKLTSKAIVNVFETGRVRGRYNAVTIIKGDSGHLSYGRSQASLGSGSLFTLLKSYCEAQDARFVQDVLPLLPRFRNKDLSLDQDQNVRALLETAGEDPIMQKTQDLFFERSYWQPAERAAASCNLTLPLSTAVIYDSHIHGSFDRIRKRVKSGTAVAPGADERAWVNDYIAERRTWLLSCDDPVPKTVYRMDEFSKLIAANKWNLELPLTIRGVVINEEVLGAIDDTIVPVRAPEPSSAARVLQLTHPYMRGDDVRALQIALKDNGFSGDLDGVFGPFTEVLVKQFQRKRNLLPDGVVGPMTWSALSQEITSAARA